MAPQPGSDSPDTITEGNLNFLKKMFGYFTNETLVSGGMRGIERKDDDSYSITDNSLTDYIPNLLRIKEHSFDDLMGGLGEDEKLPYISLLIAFLPVPELYESILTHLLDWVRAPQKMLPMNQLSETNQNTLKSIFQDNQIASDVINKLVGADRIDDLMSTIPLYLSEVTYLSLDTTIPTELVGRLINMLPKLETITLGEQIRCDMQLLQILQSKATERSNGFNFDLTTLDLGDATITAAQFNAFPQAIKASIK
ncbi:hypothetical protein HOH45_05505, partial [bacterium]|nr:hypothetical protein [bacterium]